MFNEVRQKFWRLFQCNFSVLTCTSGPTDWRTFPIKTNAKFMNLSTVTGSVYSVFSLSSFSWNANWKQMQTDWVRKIHFDFEQTVHGSYNVVNMLFFSIRQTNFKVLWFRRVFNKWNKNQIKKQYVRKSSVRWKSLETRNWNSTNFQIDSNYWKDDKSNHFNQRLCNILRASSCEVGNSGCDTLFDWIHRTALV